VTGFLVPPEFAAACSSVRVVIPGEPCAQGRPRAYNNRGRVGVFDPPRNRKWKKEAARLIWDARGCAGDLLADVSFPEGPLQVDIIAVFECPRSDWRKKHPALMRWHSKANGGDCDNLAKGIMDAATQAGLWRDDCQVARLVVEKRIGAQGEAPYVEMIVSPLR
jgi:Holliday junction resolvase RusA-like endonuclease